MFKNCLEQQEEKEYPPRGPPFYKAPPPQPPSHYNAYPQPPQVTHVSHVSNMGGDRYEHPPSNYPPTHNSHIGGGAYNYPPSQEPNYASHESSHFHPHMPSFAHHHEHQSLHDGADVANKPTFRMFTKAEPNYSLTIREGHVVLAISNPSDPHQHWIKDEKFSTKVKDEQGYPSFVLVNKATGEAIKHSTGATHPVQLTPYNPNKMDESVLWTESKDLGDSYRTIRMVNNIRLNMDALNGDKNHGGVRDGTKIVLWEWKKGDNQRWKITPY